MESLVSPEGFDILAVAPPAFRDGARLATPLLSAVSGVSLGNLLESFTKKLSSNYLS
jgi:hypothetical protein